MENNMVEEKKEVKLTDKERFLDLVRTNVKRDGVENLIDYLEKSDFFRAPASTKYHNSVEGGLCNHSLHVYDRLVNHWKNDGLDLNLETITIAALFHDLCKTNFYKKTFRNVKVYNDAGSKEDAGGRFDWEVQPSYEVEEKFIYGHGEKSVFMLMNYIKLDPYEAQAIRYHMGGIEYGRPLDSNAMKVFETNELALYLYISDMEATYRDERGISGAGDN